MLHQLAVNIRASRTLRTTELEKIDVHQPVSLWDIELALVELVHLPDAVICLHIHNNSHFTFTTHLYFIVLCRIYCRTYSLLSLEYRSQSHPTWHKMGKFENGHSCTQCPVSTPMIGWHLRSKCLHFKIICLANLLSNSFQTVTWWPKRLFVVLCDWLDM